MKALSILITLALFSCTDPKVEASQAKANKAKEAAEFEQSLLKMDNMTLVIHKAKMDKGMDTVHAMADTNVTAARDYFDALYERASKKVFGAK
jgi:hypothetical protein